MTEFERRSIISGIGQSDVGRRLGRSGLDLTIDAALEAIADAGLTPADIDGIATYPGAGGGAGPGFGGPGTPEVQDALRLEVGWHTGGIEGAAQLAAVVNAVLAVGAGLARHVLVYRTVTEATEQGSGGRAGIGIGGGGGGGVARGWAARMQWSIPFRAYSAANWLAHERPAPLPRVRHDPRAAGDDRRSTAAATPALNPKAVYREPDDARRLLRLPDRSPRPSASSTATPRSTAPPPSSCRRPSTRRRSTTPSPGWRRWARRCGAGRRGTSSTT